MKKQVRLQFEHNYYPYLRILTMSSFSHEQGWIYLHLSLQSKGESFLKNSLYYATLGPTSLKNHVTYQNHLYKKDQEIFAYKTKVMTKIQKGDFVWVRVFGSGKSHISKIYNSLQEYSTLVMSATVWPEWI